MGKLNKFQKDAIREMADLIGDLAFLGIEGEIKEEELVSRARRMIRHSEFRELFPKFVQDAFNPEQENEYEEEE